MCLATPLGMYRSAMRPDYLSLPHDAQEVQAQFLNSIPSSGSATWAGEAQVVAANGRCPSHPSVP
jgi:hypothetical protein